MLNDIINIYANAHFYSENRTLILLLINEVVTTELCGADVTGCLIQKNCWLHTQTVYYFVQSTVQYFLTSEKPKIIFITMILSVFLVNAIKMVLPTNT